jgi:hypothetical protein
LVGKPERKRPLGALGIDGRMILKFIIKIGIDVCRFEY